jgi:hypothetical protein
MRLVIGTSGKDFLVVRMRRVRYRGGISGNASGADERVNEADRYAGRIIVCGDHFPRERFGAAPKIPPPIDTKVTVDAGVVIPLCEAATAAA